MSMQYRDELDRLAWLDPPPDGVDADESAGSPHASDRADWPTPEEVAEFEREHQEEADDGCRSEVA